MKKTRKLAHVLGERQDMTLERLKLVEGAAIEHEHVRRYTSIRRFCYGKVLDFACGTGYGSYVISANDYVEQVIGVDGDDEAIALAREEFKRDKLTFKKGSANDIKGTFDTLVSLETIEHLKDDQTLPEIVERCKIDNVIISFPDKKTTHYNKYHLHDFVRQDVIDLFPNHVVYHMIKSFDSLIILFTRLPKKAPHDLFRNIRDL